MNGHAPFQRDAIMVLTNLLEKVQLCSVWFLYCLEKVIMWAMWRTYLMLLYKIFDMFGGIFKIRIFLEKKTMLFACQNTSNTRQNIPYYKIFSCTQHNISCARQNIYIDTFVVAYSCHYLNIDFDVTAKQYRFTICIQKTLISTIIYL